MIDIVSQKGADLRMDISRREKAVLALLDSSDIPARYHSMMQTVILSVAAHPEQTLRDACVRYAETQQLSGEAVYRAFRRAVYSGWAQAVTPSSMLYSRRMSPEEFVQEIITRLAL